MNLNVYNDSELRIKAIELQGAIDAFHVDINIAEENLQIVQDELKRRTIEAYYTAHLELMRVKYSDKLSITSEFLNGNYGTNGKSVWNGVFEADVTGMYLVGDNPMISIHRANAHAAVPPMIASNMRRAYLEQQRETK